MSADLDRIIPLADEGEGTPLFCVHAVSGSAYSYAGLANLLSAERPVLGFEAPGFDDERTPLRSLPALCEEYADTLREFRPAGEILLLGWSMGGVIAFDMAQRLTAAGVRVARLVLVDVGLPWVADLPPEKEIQRRFMGDMMGIAGAPPAALDAVFAGLPDDVEPEVTFAAVEAAAILPEEIDADMLGDRFVVFRAHIEALFAFEVTEKYHGPVVHIMSADSKPEYMRWDRVATDLTEHIVPGDHHSIWSADKLPALAELVRAALAGV
ncbi:alpha/beta fold hydrolase [Dactylosporangium sp. NPDC051484]|uniref:thioesterase domain-containing protein n=1 Tax=Dactylosporangium sp. NPDC051484 TaxID=3154942 RepID=UPI00344B86F1